MQNKLLITIAVVLFFVSLGMSVLILRSSDKKTVEIVQDGEVIGTIDLNTEPDKTWKIFYGDSWNTLTIENGEIWVSAASCPDKTCMKMGKLRSESLPIVCLPNHLILRLEE